MINPILKTGIEERAKSSIRRGINRSVINTEILFFITDQSIKKYLYKH
jgi:hypothetical protein